MENLNYAYLWYYCQWLTWKQKEKKKRIADNSDFLGFFIIFNTEVRITWHMLLNVYYDTINEQKQNNKINIYTFFTLNYSLPWRCS